MAEKKITLNEIDPVDIYGINDKTINHLISYFPNLKVVPRGNTIKVKGSYKDIDTFENAIAGLVAIRLRKRHLNTDDVDAVCSKKDPEAKSYKPSSPDKHEASGESLPADNGYLIAVGNNAKPITARTKHQKQLVDYYKTKDLIFALGPAGTGKTYTAIALAVRALQNKEVRRLVLTRPAVEAGERLGFLPGDLKEKLDPYLQPLYDALGDMIPQQKLKDLIDQGIIQIAPLAYMRGRTLEGSFVILDEAQNTSLGQLKMFLTRMGNNSKFIVTGDMTQIDLPSKEDSGLAKGLDMLKGIRGIGVIEFGTEDIVRHPLVSKIVRAFEKHEES